MYDGQVIYATNPTTTQLFSEWFPRGGDNAWFTVEIIEKSAGGSNFFVFAYTKALETPGDGIQISTPAILATTAGIHTLLWQPPSSFSELVRYGFGFQATTGGATEWAAFRMLDPIWFDTISA